MSRILIERMSLNYTILERFGDPQEIAVYTGVSVYYDLQTPGGYMSGTAQLTPDEYRELLALAKRVALRIEAEISDPTAAPRKRVQYGDDE
ncbi:MAG: hypothetical protein M3440_10080 [Chloroflexota bacterium]|nr:hypothetical protein [Chloroflexota bacterium]